MRILEADEYFGLTKSLFVKDLPNRRISGGSQSVISAAAWAFKANAESTTIGTKNSQRFLKETDLIVGT
ncbi:hypothetical protein HZY62_07555 [Maribacter polysiphoniae]|uniref:Uncharacterized protein n=1 Tax=Maribacter polysiphoniae TaxID=429344 RepID=A0A316EAV8_9FLAO|nr:hypothetical protein [Maribacter polysiphoniae]MBD1260439.1 hypothetical protein [Maribacter polysiphoniae]PWK25903.1 hypothetical protein LX92_00647 [Maribacter polysiphoniae]